MLFFLEQFVTWLLTDVLNKSVKQVRYRNVPFSKVRLYIVNENVSLEIIEELVSNDSLKYLNNAGRWGGSCMALPYFFFKDELFFKRWWKCAK